MSDVISFKYNGDKDADNKFKSGKMSESITWGTVFFIMADETIV